jgi:hypothetical protein
MSCSTWLCARYQVLAHVCFALDTMQVSRVMQKMQKMAVHSGAPRSRGALAPSGVRRRRVPDHAHLL